MYAHKEVVPCGKVGGNWRTNHNVLYSSSLEERYFVCQVPGCGVTVSRPWNHISQCLKHRSLERQTYIQLTKVVGWVTDGPENEESNPQMCQQGGEEMVRRQSVGKSLPARVSMFC